MNTTQQIAKWLLTPLFVPIVIAVVIATGVFDETPQLFITMAPTIIDQPPVPQKGDLYVFLNAMAERESNNNPHVVNRFGYMGKYQFGGKTLWGLGRRFKVTRAEFLGDVELQDRAMMMYLKDNRARLREIIVEYDGNWYNGIYITESGILAGAHLIGPYGVMAYFNPDYRIVRNGRTVRPRLKDGNGTSVEEYLETFSGYVLDGLE
jgi:hypothetical protein